MLSPEMQRFLDTYGIRFSKQKRLTQTFLPKEGYVTHIKNLKFYKNEGVVITNIRRGIIFYQSPWMQEYIQINTLRRIDSRSKFEKDFYKLLVSLHSFFLNHAHLLLLMNSLHSIYRPPLLLSE